MRQEMTLRKSMQTEYKQQPKVKRLTEDEPNETDGPSREFEESIHHMKEIKKIDETNKHFTTTLKINGRNIESIYNRYRITNIIIATG